MKDTCRKCKGTGEFAYGGLCFNCNGTGEVEDVRYQTTPASESKHHALRAEREAKPLEFTPPDPAHVAEQLRQVNAMLAIDGLPQEDVGVSNEIQALCEHEFTAMPYAPMCHKCGMFERQHYFSMTAPLTRWQDA